MLIETNIPNMKVMDITLMSQKMPLEPQKTKTKNEQKRQLEIFECVGEFGLIFQVLFLFRK